MISEHHTGSEQARKDKGYIRTVAPSSSMPGISELSVQNIRDSGEMLSKDRSKTTSGFFVIPTLSQL